MLSLRSSSGGSSSSGSGALAQAATARGQHERGMSIRGTPDDAARLPLPHGGVWSGRVWPETPSVSGGSSSISSGGKPNTKHRMPTILVFGDSHTQGQLGADYVGLLQSKFAGQFRIINCGANGHVLESIRQRVEPTLQAHGEDVVGVVVMGGTNDALANLNPSARKLIRLYNPYLKDLPPLTQYPAILEAIVAAAHAHCSPFLQILVMTPPLLGEDPAAPENEAVDAICDAVREMVRKLTSPGSRARRGSSGAGGGGGGSRSRDRRASSSWSASTTSATSLLQEHARVESVNPDGTPLQQPQPPPREEPAHSSTSSNCGGSGEHAEPTHHDSHGHGHGHGHHHHGHHHHGARHRRLHFIDWNRRMRKHLDEHYGDRPRKRMEPRFLPMCFNTSLAVVGGTLAQSYNAVSDARGFALLNDGVHMNERAVRLLVGLLERWVEDVQEELYRAPHLLLAQQMGRMRITAAPPLTSEAPSEPSSAVGDTKDGSRPGRAVSGAGSIDGDETAEPGGGNGCGAIEA